MSEEARRAGRERMGIGEKEFFLVSVGELNENKNQKIVLDALVNIRQRNGDIANIRYGVCGDGFYRGRMEQWISEMGLENNVTLYGYCTNIPEILGCARRHGVSVQAGGIGNGGAGGVGHGHSGHSSG